MQLYLNRITSISVISVGKIELHKLSSHSMEYGESILNELQDQKLFGETNKVCESLGERIMNG